MMMPRLQKWGSFFLPRKQNLSLSFSRAQNTQPRVCEKNFFIPLYENEEASLWPLSSSSSSSSSKERVWESTSFIITLFCKNTLFFSLPFAWKNEAFCPCFFVLFFHSFFFVESSRFGSSFSPPALTEWMLFSKREDEKVDRHPTPSSLFDCFCGKTLFFRFVLLNHTITFPYSLFFFFLWRRTCVTQREFLKVVWNAESLRKVLFFLSFFLSELYTS